MKPRTFPGVTTAQGILGSTTDCLGYGIPYKGLAKREYQEAMNEYRLSHAKSTDTKLNGQIPACVGKGIVNVFFAKGVGISEKKTKKARNNC